MKIATLLIPLMLYYGLLTAMFVLGGDVFFEFSSNTSINSTQLEPSEQDTGGLFASGVSFGRFFTLMLFGVGLPASTPGWFSTIFAIWQTSLLFLTVAMIIDSIWSG